MLAKINHLIEDLNNSGIHYCHWKSNYSLDRTILGGTDVDLLIDRVSASRFRTLLNDHSFRPVVNTDSKPFPSVEHYYALDAESGSLVHVHAYYRVITGESLVKNYHLPIEEMLLQHTREVGAIRVPTKAAELITFTLRILLKHTSLVELALLSRYWGQAQDEIKWLAQEDSAPDKAAELVDRWLPTVGARFFRTCIDALQTPAPLWRRIVLGHRLRTRLRVYARHSAIRAWLSSLQTIAGMAIRRFGRSEKNMVPQCGGAVIAFVGPEASGKSTLLSEISTWLGEHFAVERMHAGKPAPTVLTALPSAFLPLLRKMLPRYRTTRVETRFSDVHATMITAQPAVGAATGATAGAVVETAGSFPLIYAIRSVLLAHDRRSLLTRAFSRAANGKIVLCDRYPSLQSGAPDSAQLTHLPIPAGKSSLRRRLVDLETQLYQQIPPPDLVVHLSTPLEVAVLRNANREKTEPEDYVRRRHMQSVDLDFGTTPVHRINTNQPLADTVRQVKEIIWNYL